MATFKEALNYAAANPNSDFARSFGIEVATGKHDQEAAQFGIDTAPIKQKYTPILQAQQAKQTESEKPTVQKVAEGLTSVTGGKQLAQGLGQTLARTDVNIPFLPKGNIEKGIQDTLNTQIGIQTQLLQRIKEQKTLGQDTSKLENALNLINQDIQNTTSGADNLLNPNQLTGKEVIGSALQLGANLIPTTKLAGNIEKGVNIVAPNVIKNAIPMASKVLAGGATGYAYDVGNQLQDKNKTTGEAFTPGIGTVTGAALPVVTGIAGYLGKKISGFLSGTGDQAIEQALKNPTEVNNAVNKYAKTPEAKQGLVDQAKSAIQDFTTQKQTEYANNLNSLAVKDGAILSKEPAVTGFKKGLEKFGVSVDKGGKLNFTNSTLTSSDANNIKSVWSKINNWTDETPQGLDGLRQTIGNFAKDFKLTGNTRANVILDDAITALKGDLTKKIDGYSSMLSTYGEKSQLTNEVLKELSIGGNAKPSTQIKNIMNLFNKDPELQKKVVSIMGKKGADQFMNELSGAIMSSWLPQGTMLGNALKGGLEVAAGTGAVLAGEGATAAALAPVVAGMSSPRIVGATATRLGKIGKTAIPSITKKVITAGASKLGS